MLYDCIIIGGGIAGLQASIQLGRYEHRVLVVDRGNGRSSLCRSYHNLLGWADGVSGETLRSIGQAQAERFGVDFRQENITSIERTNEGFDIYSASRQIYHGRRLLIATGVRDNFPAIPGLVPCLGSTVYVCPDCDGYEVKRRTTIVMGAGEVGAKMALTLSYWKPNLIYVDHSRTALPNDLHTQLTQASVRYVQGSIVNVDASDGLIRACDLENGERIEAERGFIAFGGNQVFSELATSLGVQTEDTKHIIVDPRTKETSVRHVYAAGDVVAHSEQVSIAMGDGSQAAIWIHKSLMRA